MAEGRIRAREFRLWLKYNRIVQIGAEQLPAQLKRKLTPIYFIAGDEPLLAQECVDAIRAAAHDAGFRERNVFTVEGGFDWAGFFAETRAGSLFAPQRLIELRLPTGKPGEEGSRTLVELCNDPSPDILLVVTAGKLDKASRSSKWAAALERAGIAVTLYPIETRQLPMWIERRMRTRGLAPGPGVVDMLAHYTEGNLLACAQEIDKLAMLMSGSVSVDDIAGNLGDNARFSVFALADMALAGDTKSVARILRVLKAEGEAPVLVLWSLGREVRELARMAQAIATGRSESQVLDDFRVWQRRKPLVRKALARTRLGEWHDLIGAVARADRVVKGRRAGDTWRELEFLALALSGLRTNAYVLNGSL
jgi:DNA polymerase-3 subunit delta